MEKKSAAARPKEKAKGGIPFGGAFEGESSYREMFDKKVLPDPRRPVHKKASTSMHPFKEESMYRRAYTEKMLPKYTYIDNEAAPTAGAFHGDSNYRQAYTSQNVEQRVVMPPQMTLSQVPLDERKDQYWRLEYEKEHKTPKERSRNIGGSRNHQTYATENEKYNAFDMKDFLAPGFHSANDPRLARGSLRSGSGTSQYSGSSRSGVPRNTHRPKTARY
jgi:hypothetical protein